MLGSDWFEGRPEIENMQYLSRIAATYNSLIEALPFTEKEYENLDKRTFMAGILKTGQDYFELPPNEKQINKTRSHRSDR